MSESGPATQKLIPSAVKSRAIAASRRRPALSGTVTGAGIVPQFPAHPGRTLIISPRHRASGSVSLRSRSLAPGTCRPSCRVKTATGSQPAGVWTHTVPAQPETLAAARRRDRPGALGRSGPARQGPTGPGLKNAVTVTGRPRRLAPPAVESMSLSRDQGRAGPLAGRSRHRDRGAGVAVRRAATASLVTVSS